MKPHIKVIQRNGVDVFVTSSIEYKKTRRDLLSIGAMSGSSLMTGYSAAYGAKGGMIGGLSYENPNIHRYSNDIRVGDLILW